MRRVLLVAALVLAACGKSPSGPSPSSPAPAPANIGNFAGYWSGTISYKRCVGLHCSARLDFSEPFSFRLRQSGNAVRGVFATTAGNVAVTGSVDPDASLNLAGFEDTGGSNGAPNTVKLIASVRLDPASGLTGSLHFEQRTFIGTSRIDSYFYEFDAPIASATRGDLDAYIANLAGTWKGMYVVRECFDDRGRQSCLRFSRDEVEFIELSMAIAGTEVTGELVPVSPRYPISGRVAGRSLALEGGRDAVSITGLSGSVDEFGRLTGRFSYSQTFQGTTSRAEIDLLPLVKVP